jgi:hypothetical protein
MEPHVPIEYRKGPRSGMAPETIFPRCQSAIVQRPKATQRSDPLCSRNLNSLPMPPTNHHVTSNPTANPVFAG